MKRNAMLITPSVMVCAGLAFAQMGAAASLSLPFTISAASTILDPPPNPLDFTEPDSNSWQSGVSLVFTGGPAGVVAGYFLPCLEAFTQNGDASATFGSVSATASAAGFYSADNASCSGGPADFSAVNDIAFTFGVPQTLTLSLSAFTLGNRFAGQSSASLHSFEVFDSAGDDITSQVSYTLETPEPSTLLQLIVGILVLWCLTQNSNSTSSRPLILGRR